MNPRCPTDALTVTEAARLRDVLRLRGEKETIAIMGLRSAETLYKAAGGFAVARLTVEVIRGRLDRI